jgi:hypothetical protein
MEKFKIKKYPSEKLPAFKAFFRQQKGTMEDIPGIIMIGIMVG